MIFVFALLENTASFKMSNAPNQNQFKATNDEEGEVYVPLTTNLTNMDLYDVNIKRKIFTFTVKL